jgi:hypothetical protein
MDERCLLRAGSPNREVCGEFLLRVGSCTMFELRAWLDRIEKDCELAPAALLGMAVWTNEMMNRNTARPAVSAPDGK